MLGFPYFRSYFGSYFPYVGCPIFPMWDALFMDPTRALKALQVGGGPHHRQTKPPRLCSKPSIRPAEGRYK